MMRRTRKEQLLGKAVTIPGPWNVRFPKVEKLQAFEKANFRHQLNAKKRCDRITDTPPEDQRLLILKHRNAYVSYPVIEELLRRVKQAVFTDPLRAQEMARIALLTAEELSPWQPHVATFAICQEAKARCHANLGNVCRVLCEWKEAEFHFQRAMDLLWKGVGDPAVHAEVQRLRGSLLRDRQHFEEAIGALEESATLYEELGERHQAGVVLLKLADTFRMKGAFPQALSVHLKGVELVDEECQPMVAASAWNNLVRIYLDLGRSEEAEGLLHAAPSFYERCPSSSPVHCDRIWTEGCVYASLDRLDEALRNLEKAYEGYRALRDTYDAALVQLDRLRVLLRQGRLNEVEQSARLVYEMLRAEPLEQEAREALRLLFMAASHRQLVESLVEKTAATLRRHPLPPRTR